MMGLTAAVYCCFQLSLWPAGPGLLYEGRHLSLSLRRKITANVFYSTFTNGFFYFCHVFTFLTFLFLGERFFIYEQN